LPTFELIPKISPNADIPIQLGSMNNPPLPRDERREVDVSAEFQSRRTETWRHVKPWLFATLLAAIPWLFEKSIEENASVAGLTILLGSLLVWLFAILKISHAMNEHYRCPNCNRVPMSGKLFFGTGGVDFEEGVDLTPRICRGCGARLR
jgi:hypothetical protein